MIVRRVKVVNAGPFLGEWEVELDEGVTVVVADYEGDDERSNRAGKSFFAVDAPLYALFGTFRGSKVEDFVNRLVRGIEDAYVEFEVESSDGRVWTIRRGRKVGGEPIRELDGSKISERDLDGVVVDEILGLTSEEYRATCLSIQGEVSSFMRMTPEAKRRFVSPWFRTDRWIPRANLAKRRLNGAKRRLSDVTARLTDLEDVESEIEKLESELFDVEDAAVDARARASAAVVDLNAAKKSGDGEELEVLIEERDVLADEIASARGRVAADLSALDRDLDRAKTAVADARSRSATIEDLERRASTLESFRSDLLEFRTLLAEAKSSFASLSSQREELLSSYKELTKSLTGICPILKESCDRVERDDSVLEEIRRRGLRIRRERDRTKRTIDDLSWKVENAEADYRLESDVVADLERLRRLPPVDVEVDRLSDVERRRREVGKEAERLKFGRTANQRSLRRVEKKLEKLESSTDLHYVSRLETEVDRTEVESKAADELVGEVRARLGVARDRRELRDRLLEETKVLEAEVENLTWAHYAFGSNGIPSRELENAFGVAEDEMNLVLSDLKSTTRLRFSPTRELQSWEPACLACGVEFAKGERKHVCRNCGTARRKRRRDELLLDVVDGEHVSGFDLDSGGGKVLLSIGSRIGLSRLPSRHRKVGCEHLIIDEPDGALDAPNRAALHELLRNGVSRLGIRQVILITHADVRREFGQTVVVRRFPGDGYSAVWRAS